MFVLSFQGQRGVALDSHQVPPDASNWPTKLNNSQPAIICSSVQELSFRYGFHVFLSVTTKSSQCTVVDSISGGHRIELGSKICYQDISFGFPSRRNLTHTATVYRTSRWRLAFLLQTGRSAVLN